MNELLYHLVNYAKEVKKMREAQKNYFSTRKTTWLINAKDLEKQIDQDTDQILSKEFEEAFMAQCESIFSTQNQEKSE